LTLFVIERILQNHTLESFKKFLAARNLSVTYTDPYNLYITAQGSIADAQAAFATQINIQGLNDFEYGSHVTPAVNPETGAPFDMLPLDSPSPNGLFFSADCLRPPQTITFTTNGSQPSATYTGNRYGGDITNKVPNLPSCGYDAANMQQAYGLADLYKNHLDGTGQTIVIVDAFGSNTILSDANLFSALNGLPTFTPSNFAIFKHNGSATCGQSCIAGNWQFETTLDVEWAHAIAPGANVALVLSVDNRFANLDIANLFAIENGLGNVISNSFGIPEIALVELLPSELTVENLISEIGAAVGISQQVSTGDSGDNLATKRAAPLGGSLVSSSSSLYVFAQFLRPCGNNDIKYGVPATSINAPGNLIS